MRTLLHSGAVAPVEVRVSTADLGPDVPPLSGEHLRAQAGYYWNVAATERTAETREPLLRLAEQCEMLVLSIDVVERSH